MNIFINFRLHSGQIKAEPGNPWGGSDYPGGPGGHPNPVPEFPSASSVVPHPLERNYSPHPGYPNMPSTGTVRRAFGTLSRHFIIWCCLNYFSDLIMFIFQALNQRDRSHPRTCTGQHSRKQSILKPSSYQIHTETHWSYDTYQKSKFSRNSRILLNTVLLILWTPPPAQRWSQLSRNVEIFRETEGGGF